MSHEDEEDTQVDTREEHKDALMDAASSEQAAQAERARPKLDLNVDTKERKRGKSMFGLVLGTLKKAKLEDKERNASEAAKKRQLIDQRLQNKLKKETESVRRAEEAKKDKTFANRREEDLQLKDSIQKLRRTRQPLLANFLLTSDQILCEDDAPSSPHPLVIARSHPPPLFYLPIILTSEQEAFISRRKAQISQTAEEEWSSFVAERAAGIEEIKSLRQRVADELDRKKAEDAENEPEAVKPQETEPAANNASSAVADKSMVDADAAMDVDDGTGNTKVELSRSTVPALMQADEDDALEY